MAFIRPEQVPALPAQFLTWGETKGGNLAFVKGHMTRLAAKRAYLKLSRSNPDNLKAYGWMTIEESDREYGMNP